VIVRIENEKSAIKFPSAAVGSLALAPPLNKHGSDCALTAFEGATSERGQKLSGGAVVGRLCQPNRAFTAFENALVRQSVAWRRARQVHRAATVRTSRHIVDHRSRQLYRQHGTPHGRNGYQTAD
jgi:hypothetical protein